MAFYKYCGTDVVDRVAQGSIKLSSLAWFRQIEERGGNEEIGDRFEGRAISHLAHMLIKDQPTDHQRRVLAATRAVIENCSNITLADWTITSECAHALIFCLSVSDNLELQDSGYDACVRISDVELLAQRIMTTGRIDGVPCDRIFSSVIHRRVEYLPRVVDLNEARATLNASPFVKRERYARQREYRIVFVPRDRWIPDRVIVEFAPSNDLMIAVARSADRVSGPAPTEPSRSEVLEQMRALILEVQEFCRDFSDQIQRLPLPPPIPGAGGQWQEAIIAIGERQRVDFQQRFVRRIRDAYWDARSMGHRGVWERVLDRLEGSSGTGVPESLAQLMHHVEPGSAPEGFWVSADAQPSHA